MMEKETKDVKVTGIPENIQEQEYDLLTSLLEAADYKTEATEVQLKRNNKLLFTVHICPLSETDIATARKKAITYMPNPAGKNLPPLEKDYNPDLYRSWKIYLSTTEEDRKNIWGNKDFKARKSIVQNVETIDVLLTSEEKEDLLSLIDEISGAGCQNISKAEFAKN